MLNPHSAIKVRSPSALNSLASKTVLVVEDEFLVGFLLCNDLQDEGYGARGPFPTIEAATKALDNEPVDGAILDINLNGQLVYPFAQELVRRGIPFMFVSGYSASDIPEEFRKYLRLAKPAEGTHLLRELERLLTRDSTSAG